ncbi:hypothetical protein NBRC116188_21550 [Oceaniserpentilla sp. 4NH20-0058]|uniref:hypothetical protein n=1 Tax=Oceaniserpentilla sp. 4NH20-0058 TaxID=3127660 RepID=UPI003102CAE5
MMLNKLLLILTCLFAFSLSAYGQEVVVDDSERVEIPVGLYVTSLYDLDMAEKKYTITAWIWSTYDPQLMPKDFKFFNRIEITNARNWAILETENFTIDNPDGTKHSMTKFTAEVNQDWDLTYFPFDKQFITLNIESVELDSTFMKYVPDTENSMLSDNLDLIGWYVKPIQVRSFDYKYPTTFGLQSGAKGVYPRISVVIPMERDGTRMFWTYFLGFFVSYVIISILYFFNRTSLDSRVGLIMSALFACVGNKYTIDILLPSNSVFTLSDLIQIATFFIVGVGLLSSVMILQLMKWERKELAYKIDFAITMLVIVGYPSIIAYGVLEALSQ